ncbi:MAG: glycosyltransferase [Pseudomonadota bacterium]
MLGRFRKLGLPFVWHYIRLGLPLYWKPKSAYLNALWLRRPRTNWHTYKLLKADFDHGFYLDRYADVRGLYIDPVWHYMVRGWKQGKDPNEEFSTAAYLNLYGDVAEAKINPFEHYLRYGRSEGRIAIVSGTRVRSLETPSDNLDLPPIPSHDAFMAMPKRVIDPPSRPGVDVVIPVYKSLHHTAITLATVLTAPCETAFEVVVVNDCSPEPPVTKLLETLAESGHIRLITNKKNRGFVRSVNRGFEAHPHRDVVILNSDVMVFDGWLDRVLAPLREDPSIATVTPLSNNATIASYPNFSVDNNFELEVPSATVDVLAHRANGGTVVDVPTGIGFCMAFRRTALNEVGLFDAETFGIGYGEECDFCMRALKKGYRNVLATGVYVKHYGSTSFGPSAKARSDKAQARLAGKHPDYANRVRRHHTADPALPSRIKLDVARLRESIGRASILFFSHTRGGGIESYLSYTRNAFMQAGLMDVVARGIVLQTKQRGFVQIARFDGQELPYLPNLEALNVERHKDSLGDIIEMLDPELVHMNSFAGLTVPSIARLMEALESSARPYWHVWHDHQPLCPRITFLDAEERYCGESDASRCVPCLAATNASYEWVRIEDWRARFKTYLSRADVVSAPSEAAALRARRLADVAKVKVQPHAEQHLSDVVPMERPPRREVLRVAVVGAIGSHKGANLLAAMVRDIRRRSLPIHIDLVGYISSDELRNGAPNFTVHGRYHGDFDATQKVRALEPDFYLNTSIWPETYVYTVSVAIAMALPVVTFDLGAQAERARAYGRAEILDRRLIEDPVGVNDALLAIDRQALWDKPVTAGLKTVHPLVEHFSRAAESGPPEALPMASSA